MITDVNCLRHALTVQAERYWHWRCRQLDIGMIAAARSNCQDRHLHRALRHQLLHDSAQHAAACDRGLEPQGFGERGQAERRRRAAQCAAELCLSPDASLRERLCIACWAPHSPMPCLALHDHMRS